MADRRLYVGMEIGGTNILVAARDDESTFLEDSVIEVEANLSSDEAFTEQVANLRQALLKKLSATVDDVVFYGIGSTGQPTSKGGIDGSSNCTFQMTFAPQLLGKNRKTFRIVNDVAVAAYGAMGYGFGAKKFKNQGSPRWDGAMTIGQKHILQEQELQIGLQKGLLNYSSSFINMMDKVRLSNKEFCKKLLLDLILITFTNLF